MTITADFPAIEAQARTLGAELQHELATNLLAGLGFAYKVWSSEDVREEVIQQKPDVTRRELRELTDAAMYQRSFRDLADCTEQDWNMLSDAVAGAIEDAAEVAA